MDKSRFKRPPDVDEALSSMLWTPYDQTASNISSSSTDSLSDDEREREKRKLNRYSNPLPSSLNWWNSHVTNIHPTSLRYSFPFYGNYLPPLPHTTNNLGVMHNNNDRAIAQSSDTVGQTMNFTPSAASLSLAHSFTDDFYYYQHQQTVYKNHAAAAATTNCQSTTHKNLIDMTTHLVSSPATTTTSSSMTLPMQFNNQKSSSSSIWQHKKTGNSVETFMRHSTSKVTQPTERECLKHSSKTLPRQLTCANRAKQISHISDSNENAIASYCAINDGDSRQIIIKCNEYRNPLLNKKMNGADASCKNKNSNCSVSSHNRNDIMTSQNDHHQHYPQMPSSSSQQQHVQTQFINATIPVSLTTNNNATAASDCLASRNNVVVPCTSSVLLLSNDCQMTTTTATTENNNNLNNKLISVDVNCVNVECHKSKNIANENEIITQVHRATAADNEGNLIITSAIDLEKDSTKLSNEIITMREKRRRDRRDRRLARTRALNGTTNGTAAAEIVADSPRPPPYSSLPPQSSSSSSSIIPSIISTVPVDDTVRYMFSLPLVRRSTSDRSGKDCCGQWFNGPPLRFLVALVALGGVACTLGGATLGSIALAGSPTSHLTAGLLMTGVGIVLVTISGVAWRMTTSDTHQCTGRCGRRQCSRGNSSFGLLYPEFQHRPPPPSYQASMQEHRLRVMMLDRERQTSSNTRASPPPTYRSNTGTLLRPPIQFQRQNQQQQQHQNASSNNIVQVEIPIDESTLINDANVSNSSTNNATEYVHTNQSPTSSQTITTIASINRPDDNDIADVTSLIRINEMTRVQHENETEESNSSSSRCRINYVSSSNSSSSSSNSSNSSRCNNDRHNTLCNNKITLDHHRHHMINNENIIVIDDKCKNVNIGNMMEINKALMSNSHHTMTLPRCTQQRASFLNRENCELGVRSIF